MSLTTNAISQMYTMAGSQDNPAFTPVVQVIHIKQIEAKGAEDRYKVMFSYDCYVNIFISFLAH